jgi:hypothetical protein
MRAETQRTIWYFSAAFFRRIGALSRRPWASAWCIAISANIRMPLRHGGLFIPVAILGKPKPDLFRNKRLCPMR